VSVFEFQVSNLDLGIFDEVSVSKFYPGLGLEDCGLDYITAIRFAHNLWVVASHSRYPFEVYEAGPRPGEKPENYPTRNF